MAGFDWVLDRSKFLSPQEVKRLLGTARKLAEQALLHDHKATVRDYFIIHLALSTGLRVTEIAQLNCGDFFVDDRTGSLIVRNGKGGKKRLVRFNSEFKRHYEEYLHWKQAGEEPVRPGDPLLRSSHTGGHMTSRAIEKAFKRTAARAGLPGHYSIHCLRHTYACQLYKASGYNLRLVQKQLGHSNSHTTEVYADVMDPDVTKSLEKLYT
ncbi:MAG: hypothetical protein DRP65_00235 [Planctomycetota bacterium]|nr:MAG: hypothetical protein DRP65_00235 [Planctomycetota bacterium]